MAYNPIDTAILTTALEKAGFGPSQVGNELVYSRIHHKEPNLEIKVYTSVASGDANVKKRGADAIRVCLVYSGSKRAFGVTKAKRVLRTGTDLAIVGRMLDRMRKMYGYANQIANATRCPACGAPRWIDSGKCVAYRSIEHKEAFNA